MAEARANAGVSAMTVAHQIIRACARCGGPRQPPDKPCPGCGNPDPPVVHDLGVTAAWYRNPIRRAWWNVAGQHLAARRTRRANRYANTCR